MRSAPQRVSSVAGWTKNRPLTAEQIIARIASDSALHDVIQRLLEEMQGFRADINQLRQAIASPDRRKYLTTSEVAELFGVGEQTVRNRVNSGKWPAWRDGQVIRFGAEDVEAIRELGKPKSPRPRRSNLERRLFREKYLDNYYTPQ
jgi:excisionase family DNA binding protein